MQFWLFVFILFTAPLARLLSEEVEEVAGNGVSSGLLGAGIIATIIIVVKIMSVIESAIAEIMNILGKKFPEDSTAGKIIKYARKVLDWASNNVEHLKK